MKNLRLLNNEAGPQNGGQALSILLVVTVVINTTIAYPKMGSDGIARTSTHKPVIFS